MNITIIDKQKTDYCIVIPKSPAPVEQTGAQELACYLQKALGVTLAIVEEGTESGKAFYIGHTDYAEKAGISGNSKENWIIRMHNDNVVLTGGINRNDRGIIYSVYHFLEDIVGIRWWSPFEDYVPTLTKLYLDSAFYNEGTPAFTYRQVLVRGLKEFSYQPRMRGNVVDEEEGIEGGICHESVARHGGAIHMGRPHHVHTMEKYFPAREYFDSHPEWFAWSEVEGKRINYGHYCLSSEGFYQAVLEKLIDYIKQDEAEAKSVGADMPCFHSITFPDVVEGYCQCEQCRKIKEKSGESGYVLYFVNKLARAIAKIYPDVKLETLAYLEYIEPPKDDTLPEKNVIIRLAQAEVDLIHGIHKKGNKRYLRLLKQWSEICKKAGCELYIWDYMYTLFMTIPLPIPFRLQDTFQTFHEYGVTGIFIENENPRADFWELTQFMLMRLSENPYVDEEELIDDFMPRFYGKVAPYIKKYLYELKRASEENEVSAFCIRECSHFNYLDVDAVLNGTLLLEQAAQIAKDDSVLHSRVARLQKGLDAAILLKYFDLKRAAKKQGKEFSLDREMVRNRLHDSLEEFSKHPYFARGNKALQNIWKFFEQMEFTEEEIVPLPSELSDVNPEDVYQFYLKDTSRFNCVEKNFGFYLVEDPDSLVSRSMKLCWKDAQIIQKGVMLHATGCNAKKTKPHHYYILQDDKIVDEIKLYREDFKQGGYHLYKVGSVSGIQSSGDTRLNMFGTNHTWYSLSGMSVLFPMDACDVYLSMKFTGEMYGGSAEQEDAIYIDRLIIVRK